eukprot:scaffold4022_cov122-Isochrysis_galbana.AAC.4
MGSAGPGDVSDGLRRASHLSCGMSSSEMAPSASQHTSSESSDTTHPACKLNGSRCREASRLPFKCHS